MKKLLLLLLIVVMIASIAACQTAQPEPSTEAESDAETSEEVADLEEPAPEEEGKVMCFVMPNATHGFMAAAIQNATQQLEDGAALYPNIEGRLLTSADASEQNNQIDTLINEKVNTIVLWPHNGDDLRSGAQKIQEAGIKLVVFDRLISDLEPIAEVDMDNFDYGASSAEFLNEHFKARLAAGEKIQILEFKGDNSTASSVRSDGFNATKDENIEILQSFSTDWQRAKSLEYMESILIDNKQDYIESIDAIFSHDGEITQGIVDAIHNYNGPASLENLDAIAGMGADPLLLDTFQPMMDDYGIYHRLVYVTPAVTKYGIDVGFDVCNDVEVPKAVKIGYINIDYDNYEDFTGDPTLLNKVDVQY